MIAVSEETKTVTDATVVSSAYDTSGNGGRKLVRTQNGNLYACVKKYDQWNRAGIFKSIDNGLSWVDLGAADGGNDAIDVALCTKEDTLYIMVAKQGTVNVIQYENDTGKSSKNIDVNQSALGNISLAINSEGTELHAAWASKNSTYPNNFNIRYAKGVISAVDGSVAWGMVEQVSKSQGGNITNPSITLDANGVPVILSDGDGGGYYNISAWYLNGAVWNQKSIYMVTYTQFSPSAIFVPKEINGLANGRIWVTWHGSDSAAPNGSNIFVSYSDNNGLNWSTPAKLTTDTGFLGMKQPTITTNKMNEVFVVYFSPATGNSLVRMKKYSSGNWGEEISIAKTNIGTGNPHPSAFVDTSMSFSVPFVIYMTATKIVFSGTWEEQVEVPTLTTKTVYDIPSTDYVGAFVKKKGAVTVQAYVNDVLADAELVDDEYCFTKQLETEAPVKLRLELSRDSIAGGESDALTRVLGGRS